MAVLGAIYGVDFYTGDPDAGPFYGVLRLQDYDASPFTAQARTHNELMLSWVTPSGTWSRLRLVVNNYGPPVNEDDGVTLLEGNWGPANLPAWAATPGGRQAQIDTGVKQLAVEHFDHTDLTPGKFYYYAIFVLYESGVRLWRPAGTATGLAPADYGYTGKMLDRLPSVFTTAPAAAGEGQADEGTELDAFIDLFGFHLDTFRTALDGLRHLNDPMAVSGDLIPAMAAQYGITYEPEVGVAQTRVQIRTAAYAYRNKGTKLGMEAAASALTGWAATCRRGPNLMLDYNDSSFEQSLGNWAPRTNCTLSRYVADGAVAAYEETAGSATYPNLRVALMQITSTGGTVLQARCGDDDPALHGVPVTAGAIYALSASMRGQVARSARVTLKWANQYGVEIGTSSGLGQVISTTGYTRLTGTTTAPVGAAFAVPGLTVDGAAAGEKVWVDAYQLELASQAGVFEDARNIRVYLTADRINEVTNPRVAVNTTGWTALGTSTTLARVTDRGHTDSISLRLTTGAGGPNSQGARWTLNNSDLLPNQNYTASAWVYVPAGISGTPVHLQVSGDLETNVIGQSTGAVYDQWQRLDLVFQTSNLTVGTIAVEVANESTTTSGRQCWIDEVMVERGVLVRPYFDASSYVLRPADYLWEGTAHASRSHLYLNRTAKAFRLDALLRRSTHAGSTFSLLFAQHELPPAAGPAQGGYREFPFADVFVDAYGELVGGLSLAEIALAGGQPLTSAAGPRSNVTDVAALTVTARDLTAGTTGVAGTTSLAAATLTVLNPTATVGPVSGTFDLAQLLLDANVTGSSGSYGASYDSNY